MDPDEALKNARDAARRLLAIRDEEGEPKYIPSYDALLDAFCALDGWLSVGGFLPKEWEVSNPENDRQRR